MIRKYVLLFYCSLIFCIQACKKEQGPAGTKGADGANGVAWYGTIAGHVLQYDPYGFRRHHDLDGVKVSLNDSIYALTDTNGYYHFDSILSGNYVITASRTGFGSTQTGNVTFVKDTLFVNIGMSLKPDFELASLAVYPGGDSLYDSVIVTCTPDKRARQWIVFVSNSPSVDQAHYLLSYIAPVTYNKSISLMYVPVSDMNAVGIPHGATAYFAACSYVVDDASAFTNHATGNLYYTAIGTIIKGSAIVP